MSAEIDGPSRVPPPLPIKRLDPVPKKRQEQDREEPAADENQADPVTDTTDGTSQGKSVTGGDKLDLMI